MAHSFAAEPRSVGPTRKGGALYRSETDLTGARLNMMADPRVYRGSNYSSHAPQASNQLAQPAAPTKPRKHRPRRKESKSVFDLVPAAKQRVMIDLQQYLVESKPEVNESEAESQTDVFRPRPPSPPYVPRKTGVDASTQIEDEDGLFNFDVEVAPLLNVLVGKTLEQSLLEVLEEEELRVLRERKATFLKEAEEEAARVRNVEAQELEQWRIKQARRKEEAELMLRKERLHRKVAAASFAKTLTKGIAAEAFDGAERQGVFEDDVPLRVETQFLPSLYNLVQQNVDFMQTARDALDKAVDAAFHKQRQHQAVRELTFLAANAHKVAQKRLPETVPEGHISVFIDAGAVGVDPKAEGFESNMLGPIPVPETQPLAAVEEAIVGWLGRNLLEDFELPESGFLLSYGGRQIGADMTLVDLDVTDHASLGVEARASD